MDYLIDIFELIKKNLIAILAVLFGVVSIIGSVVYVNVHLQACDECDNICVEDEDEEDEAYTLNDVTEEEPRALKVDVKGAVKKPGVYTLTSESNIQDAILKAGGITIYGSTANINLSKKLTDEMVIYVFTKEELKKKETANEVICQVPKCECETVTITECPTVNGNGDSSKDDAKNESTEKVSINSATVEDFLKLDGIGESKAKAIVEYREKNGAFTNIEDIQKVNGIGAALYEKIKDQIKL